MRTTLTSLFFLCLFSASAQVQFEDIRLDQAFKKAASAGKMVYVHFVSSNCDQCNEVAHEAFESKKLATAMAEKCIAIKIERNSLDRQHFIDQFNPNESIGSFYIRADGDLIYRTTSTTTRIESYINDINTAWNKMVEGRSALKELDEMWKNAGSTNAMEANLIRRNELMLPLDSLLDVYAMSLPADSLNSMRVIQFISQMAPGIHTMAYTLSRKDSMFNKAWYQLPLKERIDINNRIINKSLKYAVANKDIAQARKVANFVWAVNNDSKQVTRQKRYDFFWVSYYKAIGDSSAYCKSAVYFYDKYYIGLSVDSIKREDSLITARRFATMKADTIINAGNKRVERKTVQSSNMDQYYAAYLMEAARSLFSYSHDQKFRDKALAYAVKGLQFAETAESLHDYAKLLYNYGNTQQAIAIVEKAIQAKKKYGLKSDRFETTLAKIRNNEPVIVD